MSLVPGRTAFASAGASWSLRMLQRIADGIGRVAGVFMWTAFLTLILTVALQVFARNVLQVAMIWTGDLAQLLFAWLIFVGAAVGLRRGAHYTVDILPKNSRPVRVALDWIGVAATLAVVYILVWHGWTMASIRASGTVQSLGISRLWMFLPLPVCGAMMLVFLAEAVQKLLTKKDA